MSEQSGGAVPAGWYTDPEDANRQRYWDGATWLAQGAVPQQESEVVAVSSVPVTQAAPAFQAVAVQESFTFDGGAATYWGTLVLATLITVVTLGICYPFALVLKERWKAKHSFIDGRQLVFTGSAFGLLGRWILWLLLIIVTIGIYSFWVATRLQRWRWENTKFQTLRFDNVIVPQA